MTENILWLESKIKQKYLKTLKLLLLEFIVEEYNIIKVVEDNGKILNC